MTKFAHFALSGRTPNSVELKRVESDTRKGWRRGPESNRRIKVLQTSPLPLGYRALSLKLQIMIGKIQPIRTKIVGRGTLVGWVASRLTSLEVAVRCLTPGQLLVRMYNRKD